MPVKFQLRRDTTANWLSADAIAAGEPVVEYDASGIAVGVKIGGSSGGTWNTTDYLAGTFPLRSSTGVSNINDANQFGRYVWTSGTTSLTNGPFTFTTDDGSVVVDVTVFDSIKVQRLTTEGNGTVPSKNYIRVYDGDASVWRAWQGTLLWATDATTGTPVTCTTFEAKGQATFSDGTVTAPSITNNGDTNTGVWFPADDALAVSTNGAEAIRFNSSQQALFTDGTNALPAVSNHDDPDTGIYFSGANEVSVSTGGTQRVSINAAGLVSLLGNAFIGGNLDMDSGSIQNLANPTALQDAATKDYLEIDRVGQIALIHITTAGAIAFQVSGRLTSGLFTMVGNLRTDLRSVNGTWRGFLVGNAGHARLTVTSSSCSEDNNQSLTATSGIWGVFIRTA